MIRALLTIILCALAGCSDKDVSSGCKSNSDCAPGEVCLSGECEDLCATDVDCGDNDCDNGKICEEGVCVPGCRSNVPEITGIDGDGNPDQGPPDARGKVTARHIQDELIISGNHLAGASVAMHDETSTPVALTVASATDTELVAQFTDPTAVAPGHYVLVVTNAVGADQTEVWVVRGEKGDTGDTGATGADGPAPSEGDIQAAVSAMTNLDVPSLAGRPAAGYQDTLAWGRFYEAEDPPLASNVEVGAAVDDDTASGGRARKALYGDGNGRAYGFHLADVGEMIASGYTMVEARLKVLNNTPTTEVGRLRCSSQRDGGTTWGDIGTRVIRPSDFIAADTWQIFKLGCDFQPDDDNQFFGIEFTGTVTDLSIDYVRFTPTPEYAGMPNWPAFFAYDPDGQGSSTTSAWIGSATTFNNGGHYSTTTGRFTAPVRGVYLFNWTCYAPGATGRVFLMKTGGTINQTESNNKSMTAVVLLEAGEQVWVAGNSSFTLQWYGAGAHNGFSGSLIAAF